jgi:hypothetical protein
METFGMFEIKYIFIGLGYSVITTKGLKALSTKTHLKEPQICKYDVI